MESDSTGGNVDGIEAEFAKCHRQQRRNTDFSQADNDLKRFLEEREHKRNDSEGDLMLEPTFFK